MSEQAVEQPPEKSQEQLLQEQKLRQEQEKQKQEERKRLEEEARVKKQQDIKKLQQALKGSLSGLGKTADNQSMAYVKMNLSEKQLERVFPTILKFNHVQYLDISSNALTDASIIADMPNLLHLNVSKNQIPTLEAFASEDKLLKLQYLNISTNKLKCMTQISVPSLRRLNLSENEIDKVQWKGHSTLEILELRKNKLRKLKGIVNMKNLKELYICQNQITDIRGLENLNSLLKLSVRNNKIKNILNPFPHLPSLLHLNLRENQIASLQDIKKIDDHIPSINFIANPIAEELGENLKKQVIAILPQYTKINKSAVTEEDRITFEKERLEKEAQELKERLEKEQQERKAAEQPNE